MLKNPEATFCIKKGFSDFHKMVVTVKKTSYQIIET